MARCPDLGAQLCFDGKTARGSRNGTLPGVRSLAAYAPHVSAVVAQVRVDRKTNEHKAALELLGVLPLAGTVVTGDAMFGHKGVCSAVAKRGGEYLFTVKDNQPTRPDDIACMFGESAAFSPYQQTRWATEQDTVTSTNKGHGRLETRTLRATPVLSKYLGVWPGIAQVFQLHRVRRFSDGRAEEETSYGITSLRPRAAGAARLLRLNRMHWSIENNLHGFAMSPSARTPAASAKATPRKSSRPSVTP